MHSPVCNHPRSVNPSESTLHFLVLIIKTQNSRPNTPPPRPPGPPRGSSAAADSDTTETFPQDLQPSTTGRNQTASPRSRSHIGDELVRISEEMRSAFHSVRLLMNTQRESVSDFTLVDLKPDPLWRRAVPLSIRSLLTHRH